MQTTDNAVDQALGEVPLPAYLTAEDVQFAVRAVVVHTAEQWPTGAFCRNDRAPYPCRLNRWGRRVLTAYGLSEPEIDALVAQGDPAAAVPERRF